MYKWQSKDQRNGYKLPQVAKWAAPSPLFTFLVNIVKVATTLEIEEFVLDGSLAQPYADEKIDTSNNDFEQTNCILNLLEGTADKEVQTYFDQIKMFRTIGTQTEHFPVQPKPSIHPDDINKLHNLEDYSYSMGRNTEHSTDGNIEIVEPCPTLPDFKEQLPLLDCGDVQNEVIVDSTDAQVPPCSKEDEAPSSEDDDDSCLSDSSSLYCPSASDDSSEIDDEYPNGNAPSEEKNFIVFESKLTKLFILCQHCRSPIDTISQKNQGSMVTITTSCINGHTLSWQSQPLIDGTAAGNLLIPAAILFSGNTYKHTADIALRRSQIAIVKKMKQSRSVDVCGDGRCDSPGYSAKYGAYTLMDEKSKMRINY